LKAKDKPTDISVHLWYVLEKVTQDWGNWSWCVIAWRNRLVKILAAHVST